MIGRRELLRLAGAATMSMALSRAVRAEGGQAQASLELPYAHRTPIRIGQVALRVRNLARMTAFYSGVIGLEVMDRPAAGSVLGVGGDPLLHLVERPDATPAPRSAAGLYHTAFLMPSRRDLGRWLVHAGIMNVPLTGFADHLVSEAVYLDDPEGNGIEVYRDRPREEWRWNGGMVDMASEPLDVDGIVASIGGAREPFRSAPAGTRIGHVHLKVGSVVEGFSFYGDGLGLSPTRAGRADSAFLSSGGYHHHLAMNVWDSPGAGRRDDAATGLDWLSLETHEQRTPGLQAARLRLAGYAVSDGGRGFEAVDPWGTRVRMDLI